MGVRVISGGPEKIGNMSKYADYEVLVICEDWGQMMIV
jgi:hypothetical protein